jgi:hypothetical protein
VRYAALLFALACTEPLAPVCDADYFVPVKPLYMSAERVNKSAVSYTYHDATSSFLNQLAEGDGDIVLDGSVYLDTLDLAPYVAKTTNHISITGSGGFTGSSIISGHLRLSKLRDWEVRLTDVTLLNGSIDFEYVQQSTLTRVRIQESDFRIRAAGRLSIVDSYFWKTNAQVDSALQFSFVRGAIESSTLAVAGWHGPNSYPGPITLDDIHTEFADITISKARGVTLRGGYFFLTNVNVNQSSDVFADRGEWILSDLFLNGIPQNVGCK